MSRRSHLLALATVFLTTLVGTFAVYQSHPLLYDTDAYYHLAVARQMADEGFLDGLPSVRFSLLDPGEGEDAGARGFGDKEFLFHLLLAPFASLTDPDSADPEFGGRLALALFDALILTLLAALGARLAGRAGDSRWGYLLPFALVLMAPEFTWRLVRLRPELLALAILLLAVEAVARERYRWLAVLAFVFTLGYTAFHAFLGLCGLTFAALLLQRWGRQRSAKATEASEGWPWGLLLYPLLGAAAALLLHPGFPHNLEIWAVQNLSFFAHKDTLDVGSEIQPQTTAAVFALYLPWGLALLCLLASAEPRRRSSDTPVDHPVDPARSARRRAFLTVTALTFGILYLHMSRFALYMVPFVTLAVLAYLVRPGHGLGRHLRQGGLGLGWLALPGGKRLPLVGALGLCVLLALPQAVTQASIFLQRTAAGPDDARRHDRQALAAALQRETAHASRPPHVAASWQMTPLYMFHAPWGRYLNVLDPIFLALPHPRRHAAWQALASGTAPDPVLQAVGELDSDYLALSLATADARLRQRLDADPRVETLYAGVHALYRLRPAAPSPFVLDWSVEDGTTATRAYPRLTDPRLRAVEGYVDLLRVVNGEVTPETCVRVSTMLEPTQGATTAPAEAPGHRFELAPAGPTALWLDDALHLTVAADLGAVLGQGVTFEITGADPSHPRPTRVRILTCPSSANAPGPPSRGNLGFYLRHLPRDASASG